MELKDFIENFAEDSDIRITDKDGGLLYAGKAGTLLTLLKGKTVRSSARNIEGATEVKITPY